MKKKRTLKEKVLRLWNAAGLPDFFNKYGPKQTPAWQIYLAYMEYTVHAPSWRRVANFMDDYHRKSRHWTELGIRLFRNGLLGFGLLLPEQA